MATGVLGPRERIHLPQAPGPGKGREARRQDTVCDHSLASFCVFIRIGVEIGIDVRSTRYFF